MINVLIWEVVIVMHIQTVASKLLVAAILWIRGSMESRREIIVYDDLCPKQLYALRSTNNSSAM